MFLGQKPEITLSPNFLRNHFYSDVNILSVFFTCPFDLLFPICKIGPYPCLCFFFSFIHFREWDLTFFSFSQWTQFAAFTAKFYGKPDVCGLLPDFISCCFFPLSSSSEKNTKEESHLATLFVSFLAHPSQSLWDPEERVAFLFFSLSNRFWENPWPFGENHGVLSFPSIGLLFDEKPLDSLGKNPQVT